METITIAINNLVYNTINYLIFVFFKFSKIRWIYNLQLIEAFFLKPVYY